ncbi:hypothetical protein OPV22_034833 [Ensete ventricosum]|uniref:Uncharacterized protein n=1 Tax=Ensete ventricosum TaxID=4639 RepID=A0AAV8PJK0_ENSVE|nr:hypothetical protein OPV22_034833 [Ensete ventricosum]
MGLSYSREGAARRFVRSPPLAARSGGPKRPVLACFWAVFACRGGRGERSSGRGIRAAGKVLPFASFAVRRKTASFGLFLGRFPRAAATAASGAKRQPSQHHGTPRVAQGWMGLSYSREGAARRFVRSPPLAARSGRPKTASFGLFLGRFRVPRWAAVSGRLDVAFVQQGRCCPSLRSPSVARRSLGRPKTASFGLFLGRFRVPRRPQRAVRNRAAVGAVSGRLDVAFVQQGRCCPSLRSPSVARRSLGRPKTASFGLFLGRFRVPRRPQRAVRNVSHLSTLEPPGWHRGGWGFRIAGKVPPVASFALRRSPLARAAQNGQFWPVFGPFSRAAVGRGERSSGRGIRAAGKVLPFASFAIRRSPLARAAKNGQFWPVFGSFSRAAATVASGAKRQPSQHPGTPRVAQGWMGLSYSREGAARRFVRSPPLAARSGGRKRPVLACFWAVFACCGGRVSGRLDVAFV